MCDRIRVAPVLRARRAKETVTHTSEGKNFYINILWQLKK